MRIIGQHVGKQFETDFKQSIPDYCWFKRLNDNASSFANGTNTRFTSTNECDYLLFDDNTRTLFALELKSTQGSLTYWREDFDDKDKRKSFNIKKNQLLGLQKWSVHCMVCGLIFNFRNSSNRTFFVMIDDFVDYTSSLSKKSININDVLNMNPLEIFAEKKRTRYRYDIGRFLKESKS